MAYTPLKIDGNTTGLVQNRVDHLLPNDAYPILENAYLHREKIKRKQGTKFQGRLRRVLTGLSLGLTTPGVNQMIFPNIFVTLGITDPNAQIEPGSVIITVGAPDTSTFTDNGNSNFTVTGNGLGGSFSGIVYSSGNLVLTFINLLVGGATITIDFNYFPSLPVMGELSRELNNENNEETIFFDTVYAYTFNAGFFQEFIPGTTWTGTDFNFFWGTNYWVTPTNRKLFWVTNFSGASGDPIRFTEGTQWVDFAPQINVAGDRLTQCLAMVPFRSRMVAFRTLEGANLATSVENFQRIRWGAIGNPISDINPLFPLAGDVSADAWRDDIRGKGGFLDIPTSQAIMAIGFVRDNLVIYCERSTWQLRYTGRSIAPFQIERVNAELGAESTFSAIQFDTSLVGIGDKGIVQCDSYQSQRIDIKIPDLVFEFHNIENGNKRVYGVRDFQKRLAYWIYPSTFDGAVTDDPTPLIKFPNRRLVYNYENDSWAIFIDSFTALGPFQAQQSTRWEDADFSWSNANFPWIDKPALFPSIAAGNQQGYVSILDQKVSNDKSLYIKNISGNSPNVTSIEVPSHNLQENQVIKIINIGTGLPFSNLNDQIFGVVPIDENNIELYKYDPLTRDFSDPQIDGSGIYFGKGEIIVRDGFTIQSKKFNFIDEGQTIQLGYVDILMNNTTSGAITMNVYSDYNENNPMNTLPQNQIESTSLPDTFFNSVIPTSVPVARGSTKNWQRVFCPSRSAFITIEYTLSNAQLIGIEQESDVQIDAQIVWIRRAGKQLPAGI